MLIDNFKYSLVLFPLIMFVGIYISRKLNFVDKPNSRKIHKKKIVNTSGIIIYLYLIYVVANSEFSLLIENIIISGAFVIILGSIDDRIEISPISKIFFLIMPVGYLVLNDFNLVSIGDYEFIGKIELGKFSIVFTILAVLLLTNAINYVDGTDGLLIGNIVIALLYFYYLSDKQNQYTLFLLILVFILLISLIFNFLSLDTGYKSFIGNSGSLFLGFFFSFLVIYLHRYQNIHPSYLIWACWFPVYDFLYVTFNRLKKKINFSKPDKTHLHHDIFYFLNQNHFKTFLLLNLTNIIIISTGYVVALLMGKIYSIILFVILFFVYFILRKKFYLITKALKR